MTRIPKLLLLLLLNILFLSVGVAAAFFPGALKLRVKAKGMSIWSRFACLILGIRVRNTGLKYTPSSSLIVANHSSYLDILVLGSLIPGFFVAKKEIASWPLLGQLSRMAGTIFVDRESRMAALGTAIAIEKSLRSGINVLLFPEGTTNDGTHVLDFKSSFFKIPVESNRPVQPVSLFYTHINSSPVSYKEKDSIAWHGDMKLLPHLWNVLGMKKIDVKVHFNPAISQMTDIGSVRNRKLVSSMARESVIAGYETLSAKNSCVR